MYSLLMGFACLASASSVYYLIRKRFAQCEPKGTHQPPLPPGPKGKPLIGNLFDIPLVDTAKVFAEWRSLYGDIIYLEALHQRILVLGSFEAANELLAKKSTIYSDRPGLVMLGELMGLDQSFPLLGYCAGWKHQRKLAHLALNSDAIKGYAALQEEAVGLFLDSLVDNPNDFASQLRLASGRIVLSMTYGVPIKSPESINFIAELEIMMEIIGRGMMPGAYLVDMLPWLKRIPSWVPFNNINYIATEGRTRLLRVVGLPFEYVRQRVSTGSANTSFTATCLELEGATEIEHHIRWSAGSMYGAGSETTMGTILSFILAMALYPDVQKKIRMELDRIIGHSELPTSDDRSRLPYVNAAIKETLRWNPVVPLCLPHYTSDEDIHQGFRVPKGTIVLPNIWAMSRDNISGIAPDKFAPERFLDTCVENTALDPYSYAFGFGKRICPGRFFADNSIFLFVTGLIASFVISPAGPDERHTLLETPFRHGLMRFPESFQVCILPRSKQVATELKERAKDKSG
ncbi:cytochrome P450 [Rhizopogon vinicolor AM-OR11-026]|uniref:Cytochrome P450 n=1 Tax=Rhizopogon vinicolor AM-OR11-026 TaxID=1314800 RepID=A0A1B7MN14_9AGAM|nr:cytochrome P450 [Rhizopogon vinicolor AM-OR11-026]